MKKWVLIILCLTTQVLHVFGTKGHNEENVDWQEYYTFSLSEGEATLETVVRSRSEMIIPSEVIIDNLKYPVTEIGEWAFDSNKVVSIIHIPSTIKEIGVFGFYYTNIKKLYIEDLDSWCATDFVAYPDTSDDGYVTYMCFSNPIGSETEVFVGNEKVHGKLIIPSTVREVKPYAFRKLNNISEIILSEGVEDIGMNAFSYMSELYSITFPSTLREIKDNFNYCRTLSKIELYSPVPPLANGFYIQLYAQCTLYVPAESLELYREDPVWGQFLNIMPIDSETGVGNVSVSERENSHPIIYDLYGRRVNHNDLKPGIYIINGKKTVITR